MTIAEDLKAKYESKQKQNSPQAPKNLGGMTTFEELKAKYESQQKRSSPQAPKNLGGNYQQFQITGAPERQPQPLDWYTRKKILESRESDKITAKDVVANLAPIAGDIGLSLLAPQLSIPAKAGSIARMAIPALNVASRMAGAGVGGAGGELIRQGIQGEPINPRQMMLQGALGAAGEGVGSAVIAGGKKLIPVVRPFLNVPAEVSQVSKYFSRNAIKKIRDAQVAVKEKVTKRTIEFVEQFSKTPKAEAGMKVGTALRGQIDYAQVYKPWTDAVDAIAAKEGGAIRVPDTLDAFGDLVEKFHTGDRSVDEAIKEATSWLGFSRSKDAPMVKAIMKDVLEDGTIDPGDVKFLMARFWKSYGKNSTAKANKWKEAFKASFLGDLDKLGAGAAAAKIQADETFAAVQNFLRESPAASKILSRMNFGKSDRLYFEEYPGRIVETIFGKSDSIKNMVATQKDKKAIMQLRKNITGQPGGEEAWTAATFNYIADLIRGSIKQAPDTGKSVVAPAELAEKIYQAQDTLRAAVPASTWNRLKDEADYLISVSSQFERIEVDQGYDIFTALAMLHPKAKERIVKITKQGLKQTGKATLHLMGEGSDVNTK